MNMPQWMIGLCAALPACALQPEGPSMPPGTEPFSAHCPLPDNTLRAASALPARASTKDEPQLGTVAPDTRVPSYAVTPSLRAMARATAAQAACPPVPGGTTSTVRDKAAGAPD